MPTTAPFQRPGPEMPLNVVHVASEVSPFSETGGLGMVAGALPSALAEVGIQTSVITPCYASVPDTRYERTGVTVEVFVGDRASEIEICRGELPGGVPVWLLKCDEAWGREGLYGPRPASDYADNAWRYALLCEAALTVCRRLRLHPDILHCHDWQTGLVPLLCRRRFGRWVRTVLTIHNLGYQGTFPADTLDELGLEQSLFTPEGVEFWGWVSFLKAGLVFADRLTTVSPTYAQEIRTPRFGHGLEGVLHSRGEDLRGILNGVPPGAFDPTVAGDLPSTWSAGDLSGKATCKAALESELGLTRDDSPLLVAVSRLVSQKGVDLIPAAVSDLLDEGKLRVAVLGSGNRDLETALTAMATRWPGRFVARIGYDESLARLMLAGGDALIMPSRYEPCGLTQLFALRFGTLPVARATGGLADTIRDGETGFLFPEATSPSLRGAVDRLLVTWHAGDDTWADMQRAAMSEDFSWNRSALQYAELYDEVQHAR